MRRAFLTAASSEVLASGSRFGDGSGSRFGDCDKAHGDGFAEPWVLLPPMPLIAMLSAFALMPLLLGHPTQQRTMSCEKPEMTMSARREISSCWVARSRPKDGYRSHQVSVAAIGHPSSAQPHAP